MERSVPFSEQLKQERERRGLSQAELAVKLKVDTKTVIRWESGNRLPRHKTRRMLCKMFGKTLEEFGLLPSQGGGDEEDADEPEEPVVAISVQHPTAGETSNPQYEDWGEAPGSIVLQGRDKEVHRLLHWIVTERSRLVAIVGMGGFGKTTLAVTVAEQARKNFAVLFWRSLHNAPPFRVFIAQFLQCTLQANVVVPDTVGEQIQLVMSYLRQHRCLLILDNMESIIQPGQRTGYYLPGYEAYGELLQQVGETRHKSCLLMTSREQPREIGRLEGRARVEHLMGVNVAESQAILHDEGLYGSAQDWHTFVTAYGGNPLALKLASRSISSLFNGEISRFLTTQETAFGDIYELLEQQFVRLSSREQELLYWLAIEREATTLETLRENCARAVLVGELLEALESLKRRYLLETRGPALFTLQAVIREYVTQRMVRLASQEFLQQLDDIWLYYALIKAQAPNYVRESQLRFILEPVAGQLVAQLGREGVARRAHHWLDRLRQESFLSQNYAAGNLLNLLVHLQVPLAGADFSSLTIRQAYLQHVTLPRVNFSYAHFHSTLFTHTFGNVLALAFHPTEDLLATGTASGEIWVYERSSDKLLYHCSGHQDGVWSLAFSPDGRLLASGSDDQSVRLWDASTGQSIRVLNGHNNRVRSLVFCHDGQWLASGSEDSTIRVWEVASGACLQRLTGHSERVWSVAYAEQRALLASGSEDGTIRLWCSEDGSCQMILHEQKSGIRALAFSTDGTILASAGEDKHIYLWQTETGQLKGTLEGHSDRIYALAFQPGGTLLASGSEDQSVRLWDSQQQGLLRLLRQHSQAVRAVAFSPDGQLLVSGGDDQSVRFWDWQTGHSLKTLQGYTNRIRAIAAASGGTLLASGGEERCIRLWNVQAGSNILTLVNCIHPVRSLAFNPDGMLLASSGDDAVVRLWNIQNAELVANLEGHSKWVWAVAFSPDGRWLASGGEDQSVRLWNVEQRAVAKVLRGHQSWVRAVMFSPDSCWLASGGDDHVLSIWNMQELDRPPRQLQDHQGRIRSVAFSPDGQMIATGSEDQTIRLWNIEHNECVAVLSGHTDRIRAVAFSPDGQWLVSGGDDREVRLWHVANRRCMHVLYGHRSHVRAVTFCRDGQVIASGSDDGTLCLWEANSGTVLQILRGDRPYEGMKIAHVQGLTDAQISALKELGATDQEHL